MRAAWTSFLAALVCLVPQPARARDDFAYLRLLAPACDDSARADSAYRELGSFVAASRDSFTRAHAYHLRFSAAKALGHLDDMRAAADSSVLFRPADPTALQEFAHELTARQARLPEAEEYARRAVEASELAGNPYLLARALITMGHAQYLLERPDLAAGSFERALTYSQADSQWTLLHLGRARARSGEVDKAIDAYIRCAGVFAGDTGCARHASQALDSLSRAGRGSHEGLEQRLTRARADSRQNTVFDSRRDGRPVRPWRLRDLRTGRMRRSEFSRGIVVVDFWGTWCAPCRRALPLLDSLAREYRGRPVRFETIASEGGTPEQIRRKVLDFARENRITLPVLEADEAVIADYAIESYPTTLVIRGDRVLYRNVGFSEPILREQLASLIEESPPEAGGSARRR